MITSLDTVFPLALSLGFGAACDHTSILWGFIWEVSSAFFPYMELNTVALISTSSAVGWNNVIFLFTKKRIGPLFYLRRGIFTLLFLERPTRELASDKYDP